MIEILNKETTGTIDLQLDEVKSWLRVDSTADDVLITSLISSAYNMVEEYTGSTITEATYTIRFSTISTEVVLPYQPIVSIVNVKDSEGTSLDYTFDGINIVTLEVMPTGSIDIEYDAGNDIDYKNGLKLVLLNTIALLYENRGDKGVNISAVPYIEKYKRILWL